MDIRREFTTNYLIHLRGALPPELCRDWVEEYFTRTGIDETDPATYPDEPNGFTKGTRRIAFAEAAPQAWEVICELLGGEDKIDERTRSVGNGFNLNANRGADRPWCGPGADSPGWHKDGWFFRHFLDSPEQALLCLVIWRDIQPHSGGTFFAPDSVPLICRELLAHPEGLPHNHSWGRLIEQCRDFRELSAGTGDIIILHPFMLHAGSQNPSGRFRFMNNSVISLREPMQFNRIDGAYTALEASILGALQVDSLDFDITRERKRSEGFSRMEPA
ncbi:MAG: hypothetical protein GKR89_05130 [Candidatus Latescibacteria bacterium]|nr:hypothetical protein [Candidatus Latescibacterota bacterium]